MSIKYEFKGEKGHRQVVKTIDIHEESYKAITKMLESGNNMNEGVYETIIEDVECIFGGSVFGSIIKLVLDDKLRDVISDLATKNILKEDIEPFKAFEELSEGLFPCMCYSGEYALYFFGEDQQEIISLFEKYIKPSYLKEIAEPLHFNDMDGKVAFGTLLYLQAFNYKEVEVS